MYVGTGLGQGREISGEILPDAWIGSCERKEHRAGSLTDKSAGFKTAFQAGLVFDETDDRLKVPYSGDRFDRRHPMRLVGKLGEPHHRACIGDFETSCRWLEALESRRVIFVRSDFDECTHDMLTPAKRRCETENRPTARARSALEQMR